MQVVIPGFGKVKGGESFMLMVRKVLLAYISNLCGLYFFGSALFLLGDVLKNCNIILSWDLPHFIGFLLVAMMHLFLW